MGFAVENAYTRLRNAGLITHDQDYLFTPVRSTRVQATARAKLLLALFKPSRRGGGNNTQKPMPLLREIVSFFQTGDFQPDGWACFKGITSEGRGHHSDVFLRSSAPSTFALGG